MKRRIFIAINIPNEIRERLLEFKKYWPNLPAHWIKPENIHITLVFIGYVTDLELGNIERVVSEVSQRHDSFEIKLSKILLGPPHTSPRMVWAEIQKPPELLSLQKDLENSLYETPDTGYEEKETRPYSPHITLCRFNYQDFRKLGYNKNEKFDINFSFPVNSIEIMESTLSRTGAEYKIVKSVELSMKRGTATFHRKTAK